MHKLAATAATRQEIETNGCRKERIGWLLLWGNNPEKLCDFHAVVNMSTLRDRAPSIYSLVALNLRYRNNSRMAICKRIDRLLKGCHDDFRWIISMSTRVCVFSFIRVINIRRRDATMINHFGDFYTYIKSLVAFDRNDRFLDCQSVIFWRIIKMLLQYWVSSDS